jgi:biotin carboxyl carrier protein
MKRLRVTVEGKVYDVLVEMLDEAGPSPSATAPQTAAVPVSAPVAAAPVANAPAASCAPAGTNDIVSPLAGKVVSIDVKPGQPVDEGTQVATLEAMKMNTYVYAPRAGRVGELVANAGDGVEEGAVLLRLA